MSNYTENFSSVDGDVTDAAELEAEFDAIAAAVNSKIDSDGSGTMTGSLNMGSNKITNLTDPTSAQDAASKAYVDAAGPFGSAASGDEFLGRFATTPTGWTKSSVNNKALRIVSGTPGSDGGSNAFSTAFNSNITSSSGGSHTHTLNKLAAAGAGAAVNVVNTIDSASNHTHTTNVNVQYRDFNIFTKS